MDEDEIRDELQLAQTKNLLIDMLTTVNNNPELAEPFWFHLNTTLDNMADNDIFGTDAQLDPRGDPRT